MRWPVSVAGGAVAVEVADSVYPLAAVHGAALVFMDRAWVRLHTAGPGRTRLELRPKLLTGDDGLHALGGDLLNELLHQALRLDVGARTEKLRELVIGKAVIAAEAEAPVAFADDPLGIARPWEQRFTDEDKAK